MTGRCERLKTRLHGSAGVVALFLLAACSAPNQAPTAAGEKAGADGPGKTLVIAQVNSIKGFGPWWFASTGGGGASLGEIHTIGLTSEDNNGNIEPRAAARLPSFDDGTIVVRPDGRMRRAIGSHEREEALDCRIGCSAAPGHLRPPQHRPRRQEIR